MSLGRKEEEAESQRCCRQTKFYNLGQLWVTEGRAGCPVTKRLVVQIPLDPLVWEDLRESRKDQAYCEGVVEPSAVSVFFYLHVGVGFPQVEDIEFKWTICLVVIWSLVPVAEPIPKPAARHQK